MDRLQSDDIAALLLAIDDRVAQRSVTSTSMVSHSRLPEIRSRLRILQNLRAPLFITDGSSLSALVKRVINLPIHALSSKQVIYNRELNELLLLLVTELESVRRDAARTNMLLESIDAQQKELEVLKRLVHEIQAQRTYAQPSPPDSVT
jgi:hypothetical protein